LKHRRFIAFSLKLGEGGEKKREGRKEGKEPPLCRASQHPVQYIVHIVLYRRRKRSSNLLNRRIPACIEAEAVGGEKKEGKKGGRNRTKSPNDNSNLA